MHRQKPAVCRILRMLILVSCLPTGLIFGQNERQLDGRNLEDLLNMEISSVSKKADKLQDAATSIYVVTTTEMTIIRSSSTPISTETKFKGELAGEQLRIRTQSTSKCKTTSKSAETT